MFYVSIGIVFSKATGAPFKTTLCQSLKFVHD
jgi:hypothetical protein